MAPSNEVMIMLTICIILTLVFFLLLTILWKKLKKKEDIIAELSKKLNGTEKEISRRNAFRVKFSVEKCKYSIIEVANKPIHDFSWEVGEMKDISFSGMKLTSDKSIPVHEIVKLIIKFNLEGEDMVLIGKVVRQEIYVNKQQKTYGIQFTNDIQNQKLLFKALNKINHYRQHIGAPNTRERRR